MDRDTTDCQVSALRDAPVANQIRREPPIYVPGRVVCDAAGQCYDAGGYWTPGRVYTVDVNAPLRGKLTDQCMAGKGYVPARIRQCPAGASQDVPAVATTTLPPLTPDSCAIKYQSGAFQIVEIK